jgi:hypothetical protein
VSARDEEIERYARAVLARRRDVAAPGTLGERRVRVQLDEDSSAFGYRESPQTTRKLLIKLSYFSSFNLWMLPVGLAAACGVAHAWWLRRAAGFSLWLAAITLLVAALVLRRVLALFDHFEIRVTDGVLRTRDSLFWPRLVRTVRLEDVTQLFVTERAGAFAVAARLRDGRSQTIVSNIASADFALYLERLIEIAFELPQLQVPGEIDRNAAPPRGSVRRAAVIQAAVMAILAGGSVVMVRGCGVPLAELDLADEPRERRFTVERPTEVFVTTDLEFTHAKWRTLSEVPKALVYEIEIRGAASVVELSCDPTDVFLWISSSSGESLSSYEGPIRRCTAMLPPGSYSISARRVWRPELPRIELDSTSITLRARP